ncbi:MAG: hypothetical protein Q8K63_02515 [Acidimicrobiales bacterium]|nr:hypothetical protein [Acidimicrobiales bacterium]
MTMHRWLFVGLALMAAVGGVGTALVSGQRVQNPSLGLELIAMSEESSAGGYVVRFDPSAGGAGSRPSLPDPDELAEQLKTAEELAAEHNDRLKEIVAEFGWPGKRLVGADGAHAAWLLLQRADLTFQQQALELMEQLPDGQVDKLDLAQLTDRIAVRLGEPQTYGTQLVCIDDRAQIGSLVDPERIDARRAEVGLPPLAQDLENADGKFRAEFGACTAPD